MALLNNVTLKMNENKLFFFYQEFSFHNNSSDRGIFQNENSKVAVKKLKAYSFGF